LMRGWYQEAEATYTWAVDEMDTGIQPGYEIDVDVRVVREYLRAMLGWFCLRSGKLQKAELLLQSSLASLRAFATGIEMVDVLYYVGAITWMNGDYPRARTYFIEGLAIAEKIGSPWDLAQASIGMGIITQTVGEYEEANQHWQRALDLSTRLGDQRAMAWVLNFSCILKRTLGDYVEAQNCLRKSLSLSESVEDQVTYGMALSQLGLVTQALGDNVQAIGMLIESVPLLRQLGEFWSLIHALIGLGMATLSTGDYAASHDAYYEALTMAWEKQALPEVLEVMTGMASWSAQQGALEQALVNAIFVLNHPAATEQTKEAARQLRTDLEALLTSKQIRAAQGRVESIILEVIVDEALAQANLA
jgi:tetratricopeptide (TPR) repeat protein